MNKEFLVEVVNASLLINNQYILNNISFYIGKEEIVGIVGESGSGKSLTALSLIGLLPKDSELKPKNMLDVRDPVSRVSLDTFYQVSFSFGNNLKGAVEIFVNL